MNSFLNHLIEQAKLQNEVWTKIKTVWADSSVMEQQLILDDKKKIIAGKIDGTFVVIGYIHLEYITRENELIYFHFINDLKKLTAELRNIITAQNWKEWKEIIITTHQISLCPNFPLSELPLTAKSYLYVNDYPNFDSKQFHFKVDEKITKYQKGEELLNYMINRGNNLGTS